MKALKLYGLIVILAVLASAAEKCSTPAPPPSKPFTHPPVIPPTSGEARRFESGHPIAPLELETASGADFLVRLESALDGTDALDIYVRGGDTVKIQVPLGTYTLKYAAGDTWYGYEYLFGPDTSYSKADETFVFTEDGEQITGYSIVLYRVPSGNLITHSISASEF